MKIFYGISFLTKTGILSIYLLPRIKKDSLYEYVLIQIIGIIYCCIIDCIKIIYHIKIKEKEKEFIAKKWVLIFSWVIYFMNVLIHLIVLFCSFYISLETIKTKKNIVFITISSLTYFIPLYSGKIIKYYKERNKKN